MKITPMNGFAILKPIEAKAMVTPGGIDLSLAKVTETVLLEVHALAETNQLISGAELPIGIKVGDTVLCGKFSGEDVIMT